MCIRIYVTYLLYTSDLTIHMYSMYIYCRGPGGSSGDSSQEMLARVLSTLLNELDGIGGGGGEGGGDSSGMCRLV